MVAGPQVRCKKCDDVIRSEHRHDFKWCRCGAIAVDGGGEYLKLTGAQSDIEVLGEPDLRGVASQNGTETLSFINICDKAKIKAAKEREDWAYRELAIAEKQEEKYRIQYERAIVRTEKAEAALGVAVEGLRQTYVRLACGREGELENEVDEALSILEKTFEALDMDVVIDAVLEGQEEKP